MKAQTSARVRAFCIHPCDNVATLLDGTASGPVAIIGGNPCTIEACEPIRAAHKIAISDIRRDDAVIKYGLPIGRAVHDIRAGSWVHLHNLASNYDTRSASLNLESGAPGDNDQAYE